jgi:deoxyadenosine/deoxycytidine kinase
MSKERYNQIINEAYENYCKSFDTQSEIESHSFDTDPMTKIMFVEKIKNLDWFSETWGLKIEERELSLEERFELFKKQNNGSHPEDIEIMDDYDIPTKLITLTYNNETIESYE